MAKVKTYWDTIKNNETFYHGGSRGWEVHLIRENWIEYNHKTNTNKPVSRLVWHWPYFDGVPRAERAECRKDILEQRQRERILGQASRDREEYRDLCARVYKEDWDKILATGIRGFELGRYIRETFLTEAQAYTLFYRM
jgi:hypothetical protein